MPQEEQKGRGPHADRLRGRGADIRLGRSLRAVRFAEGRVVALAFDGEEETVQPGDRVIVAVPPWAAEKLLPGVTAPQMALIKVDLPAPLSPITARISLG